MTKTLFLQNIWYNIMKSFKNYIAHTWLSFKIKYLIILIELSIMELYHDKETIALMKQIINEDKPFLLTPSELFFIYSIAKHQTNVDGDYAEVGVFKGATAKAICEAKRDKNLYLFDTFEGLPEVNKIDILLKSKMFRSTFEEVQHKLAKYKNVYIHKGLFPKSGALIQHKKFAFVHLDIDIYQSTKDCLEFFYNRMSKGGIIVTHDYNLPGVKKAFNEFYKNKAEQILELPMSQCMIIKR